MLKIALIFWSTGSSAGSGETEGHYIPAGWGVNPFQVLPSVWKQGQKGIITLLPNMSGPFQEEMGRMVNGICHTQWDEVLKGSLGEVGLLDGLPNKTLLLITPAPLGAAAHPAARDELGGGTAKAARAGAGFCPRRGLGRVWMGWWLLLAGLAAASSACGPV